jgi:hypothetical protein
MRRRVFWFCHFIIAVAAAIPHLAFSQIPAEELKHCPPLKCPRPSPEECSEVIDCPQLYTLQKRCAPRCAPKFCDGMTGSSSLDVDANCRITSADALLVTQALNGSLGGRVNQDNFWFDSNSDGSVSPLDVLRINDALSEHGCVDMPTPTPRATAPVLQTCTFDRYIQVLTKYVPEGTLWESNSMTVTLPADAVEIKIALVGNSVDDHSGRLDVNGVTVYSVSQSSSLKGVNDTFSPPIVINSWRAGQNTLYSSAGENPKYNKGGGHIGAGWRFTGTYKASVCN